MGVSSRRSQPIVSLCGCQEVWHWAPLPSCPAWIAATTRGWLTHSLLSCVWPGCRMPAGSLLDSTLTSGSLCQTVSESRKWCVSSGVYDDIDVVLWFKMVFAVNTFCCLSKQGAVCRGVFCWVMTTLTRFTEKDLYVWPVFTADKQQSMTRLPAQLSLLTEAGSLFPHITLQWNQLLCWFHGLSVQQVFFL